MKVKARAKRFWNSVRIPTRAVREFLHRPRQDWRKAKGWTETEIQNRLAALPVEPPIWKRLRRLQRISFLIAAELKRFALFLDMGCGKTFVSIALARYFRKAGVGKRYLVLVRSRVNKAEWKNQIELHSPNTSFLIMPASIEDKWTALEENDCTLTVESYQGLLLMIGDKQEKKGKQGLVINQSRLKKLANYFDGVFCDESHNIKGDSLWWRTVKNVSKDWSVVILLTGTPMNKDPMDLWHQLRLVDFGKTLGETIGLFRAAFYTAKPSQWGVVDYSFDHTKERILHTIIANTSLRWEADEADLPRVNRIQKIVNLDDEASPFYERAKAQIRAAAAQGDFQETRNSFMRARQIVSGFVGYTLDGTKAELQFKLNPKLELLCELLSEMPETEKAIIFVDFVFSAGMIAKELKRLKYGFAVINGATKDVTAERNRFLNDPACRFVILSNAMAEGQNLQIARRGFFYEMPVSAITRKQCIRRFERQGSPWKSVFVYDFIADSTVDNTILEIYRTGGNLFKAIIDRKISA